MKRWLRLVIAAVVVAALVVTLVVLRRSDAESEAAADADSNAAIAAEERVSILETERESITSIEIDRDGDSLVLQAAGDGTFTPDYRYDVEWSESGVNRIVGSATSLTAIRTIDQTPSDLDQYGLDNPRITVTVALEDEETTGLEIGSRVPGGRGYYVRVLGDQTVYSASSAWISPFFSSLDDLRDKTLPEINPQALQEIAINTISGRSIVVERVTDGDPELTLSPMAVLSPFGRRYSASSTWLEELAQLIPSIQIIRYAADEPSDLTVYGLAPPEASLSISDGQNTLELEIGAAVNGARFARFPDGRSVFVVGGVEQIVRTTPYETVDAFAYIISIDLVDRVVIETDNRRYEARIEREPPENPDDPEAEPVATYFFNGEEMDEDLFKTLYQWFIGLLVDAEVDSPADAEADLSITYEHNSDLPDVTLRFVPLDSNYYAVFRDGSADFKISRNKIRRLKVALEDPESIRD